MGLPTSLKLSLATMDAVDTRMSLRLVSLLRGRWTQWPLFSGGFVPLIVLAACALPPASADELGWPLRCPDGSEGDCLISVSYPDVDGDGRNAQCEPVRRRGHTGTDMVPTADAVLDGVAVLAAAPGQVVFVQDAMFDACPADHPQCRPAVSRKVRPNFTGGYTTCTVQGQYCADSVTACFWCFSGNYVVLDHGGDFTAYLHLKTDSATVEVGHQVNQGDKLGYVGSSGNSDGPHLHFEVWRGGLFKPIDPWQGVCGGDDAPWVP